MFTLQKLNVVRLVESETQRDKLIHEGFTEIIEKVAEMEIQKVDEVKNKKTKGKE